MDKHLVLTSRKNRGILQEAVIENSLTEAKADEQKLIDFAGNSLAKRFLSIKNRLKSPENDIYYWLKKSLIELEYKVNEIESAVSKTKQKEIQKLEGAELVVEENGWKVYRIDTYEASCLYGKGTKWCTASTETRKPFDSYKNEGIKLYYFIKNNEKYAIALYPEIIDGLEEFGIEANYELYDATDELITALNQIKSLNLPKIPGVDLILEVLPTEIEGDVLVKVYPYNQGKFVIPDGIKTIGAYAFSFCTSLKSITIPSSVTSIDNGAFDNCQSLTSIIIPNSVTTIGVSAFHNCDSLKSLTIPNSVKEIGDWTFTGCTSLESITIPNSVTSIGKNVFHRCKSLTIYAEAPSKPAGWDADWNPDNRPVVWDYKNSTKNNENKLNKDIDSSINEAVKTNSFTPYTAGYILEDGSLLVMDEYHGEEEIREFYPEYSNTHPEEDTCVRLYSRPNEAQYKRLEEIIDYYLDHENYCKVEIWNKPSGKYSFYEVYSLYEGACEDTTWDEKIGNWTGYKLVQIIKNYFAKRVIEAMKAKENISNPLISKYIKECIAVMKQINFGFKDEEKILTYDDIDAEEGSTISTFGVMSLPTRGSNNFKLVLNKHMFTESEEAIKNTIYHELCHYVVSKIAINLDIIYTKNGKWYHNSSSRYNFSDFKGHGYQWKRVANIVGRVTKQNITRTSTYDVHTGVGAHAETKYKYIVKCKNCSKEFKYTKRTKFINAVLAGNGYTENWWCNCSDGRKGHYFEIIKGNN